MSSVTIAGVLLAALVLAACSQQPGPTGAVATAPAAASSDPVPSDLSTYIAGRSFTYVENGTVTEIFLAGGTGEWRRPSGRSGPFRWTLENGTFCRLYAAVPAAGAQKAWAGGTWCGTISRVAAGLQYTDAKSQGTGVLKEVAPGAT